MFSDGAGLPALTITWQQPSPAERLLEPSGSVVSARLVWFFGPSAAGKATLIRTVAADQRHELRMALRLGNVIEANEFSLGWGVPRAAGLVGSVLERCRAGVPQLIRGQNRDIRTDAQAPAENVVACLARVLPDVRQEVVFVWASPEELNRRCQQRARLARGAGDRARAEFWEPWTVESNRHELLLQVAWTKALGLPIRWVKSTSGSLHVDEQPVLFDDQPSRGAVSAIPIVS